MANVGLIINSMNVIAGAAYAGRAQSRKSLHQIAFDRLQGSARQIAAILTQNPSPNSDGRENLQGQFDSMRDDIASYCTKTDGTHDVLRAFNEACVEWDLLVSSVAH